MEIGDYLPALRTTNARMDDAAAEAVLARGWAARVPGSPGWRLADPVRHVAEVQHFRARVVRTRAAGPADRVWTWGRRQDVAFVLRRRQPALPDRGAHGHGGRLAADGLAAPAARGAHRRGRRPARRGDDRPGPVEGDP